MGNLFRLRHILPVRQRLLLQAAGIALLILAWFGLTTGSQPIMPPSIFPHPMKVLAAFPKMVAENNLLINTCRSIALNLAGYIEAVAIAVPAGFLIGLFPLFRGSFQRPVDAFRYVPLTAVTGLFILWFGLGVDMKVHFLALGILIYLLPVVVARIDEVDDIFVKTVYTLGATNWQTIRTVFMPAVLAKLSDDIRVLTAISWTYIIIAESLGNEGGLGALIWRLGQRQGKVDALFALLFLIIVIGFLQDKVFTYLDKELFPHKYQQLKQEQAKAGKLKTSLNKFFGLILYWVLWIALGIYLILLLDDWFEILGGFHIWSQLFGEAIWSINTVFFLALAYKLKKTFFPKHTLIQA
ncbi:MAG: ABC transporter permease subunit [Saprospiraceae bacterium]|nr:ABC transporter permease subunit [Saprospiraceae bacterium]